MEDAEYIKSLENALIFLCSVYETAKETYRGTDAFMQFPLIQGTRQSIPISRIAEISYDKSGSFEAIECEILKRRLSLSADPRAVS